MRGRTLQVLLIIAVISSSVPLPATAAGQTGAQESTTGIVVQLSPEAEKAQLEQFSELREEYPSDAKSNAFLLDGPDGNTWLVFSDTPPKPGKATVKGTKFSAKDLGTEYGIIIASSVEITQKGTPTDLETLRENPERFDGKLVRITNHYRQLSFATETQGPNAAEKTSLGGFAQKGTAFNLKTAGDASRAATFNLSKAKQPKQLAQLKLRVADPIVGTRTPRFWMNARTTVDLAVIVHDGTPFYRVVQTNVQSKSIDGPQAVTDNGKRLEGDAVSFNTSLVGATISSQETILAASKCAPMSATNPATGCIPIPVDTTLHTGVLFDGVPQSPDDALVYVALSNQHQQKVAVPEHGQYEVTGRVVSTSQLEVNVEASHALIVYEMERSGGLKASEAAKNQAQSYARERQKLYQQQMQGGAPTSDENSTTTTTTTASKTTTERAVNGTTEAPVQTASSSDGGGNEVPPALLKVLSIVFAAGALISWIASVTLSAIAGYQSGQTNSSAGDSGYSDMLRRAAFVELGLAILIGPVAIVASDFSQTQMSIGLWSSGFSQTQMSIGLWFGAVVFILSAVVLQILIWIKEFRGHSVQTSDRHLGMLLATAAGFLIANFAVTGEDITLLGAGGIAFVSGFAWLLQWTYEAL